MPRGRDRRCCWNSLDARRSTVAHNWPIWVLLVRQDGSVVSGSELQRLVDERRFEDVLQRVSLAEVAHSWMRYHHRYERDPGNGDPGDDDPDWWAVEMWQLDEKWADEDRLRTGVLELVAAAEKDSDYGAIGAGIVEYMINDDEERLQWIETQARESDGFRRSLANVYVWGVEPDSIAARIEAAAGVRLPRPRGWRGP
jgi:hypothetical protein